MKKAFIWLFFALFFLTACHVNADQITETQASPESKAVNSATEVTGKLVNAKKKAIQGASVFLAEVYRQDGKAAFLLDSANSPSGKTDKKGNFAIKSIKAGEYVLIIGNPMSKYQIHSNTDQEPVVFTIEDGKKNNLGTILTTILK